MLSSSWRLGGAWLELLVGPSIVTGNTGLSVLSDAAIVGGAVGVDWFVVTVVAAGTDGPVSSASDGEISEESSDKGIFKWLMA